MGGPNSMGELKTLARSTISFGYRVGMSGEGMEATFLNHIRVNG